MAPGTAMDLELAKYLGKAGKDPRNHVRFLWVGAEELGRSARSSTSTA